MFGELPGSSTLQHTDELGFSWTWFQEQATQPLVVHRPVPRYPPAYNHGVIRAPQPLPLEVPISDHPPPGEGESTLRSICGAQAWASGCSKPPRVHVPELPKPITHVVPLRFSKKTYKALLQLYSPLPPEIKIPKHRNPYSFAALEMRGCHPVIYITETGGQLSKIAVDLNGTITTLNKNNFCRIPGCGYWAKSSMARHRLAHFTDRGYDCQNPCRRGTDAPKRLQCQLSPGQYLTRLDLFKSHFDAPSCRPYAPPFAQCKDFWRGPSHVEEKYLLPFTRDVHIPFR